jgi:hypothetical protein
MADALIVDPAVRFALLRRNGQRHEETKGNAENV